jgi:hypothetical protein
MVGTVEGPIAVETVPEFTYCKRKRRFYVHLPGVCLVFDPQEFFPAIAAAVAVSREHRWGAEVVPLAAIPLHAASASGNPSK